MTVSSETQLCHICGAPSDARPFDVSGFAQPPAPGNEIVLASFDLHRNYCGLLMYFAQFTRPNRIETPGFSWQVRCNGRGMEPYASLGHVLNPWGLNGFPVNVRLEAGASVELVIRNIGGAPALQRVGGRLLGRYWYNDMYGGAPRSL
jgi:hypothetical protein